MRAAQRKGARNHTSPPRKLAVRSGARLQVAACTRGLPAGADEVSYLSIHRPNGRERQPFTNVWTSEPRSHTVTSAALPRAGSSRSSTARFRAQGLRGGAVLDSLLLVRGKLGKQCRVGRG